MSTTSNNFRNSFTDTLISKPKSPKKVGSNPDKKVAPLDTHRKNAVEQLGPRDIELTASRESLISSAERLSPPTPSPRGPRAQAMHEQQPDKKVSSRIPG